jgi:curved DNA-binding protein CbpA
MHGAANQGSDAARVPRLAPDWERKGRQLSPQEGFLLSRIDGRTPWATLRAIGGLPPEQIDTCLERWIAEGLIVVEGGSERRAAPATPPARACAPAARAGAVEVDPGLDLSVEFQQRVLAFERELERPYHEILGVGVDAAPRDIKRAYFKLSKDFHPDRYFRKRIGAFDKVLDRIFKKVALAYELLMDPATRAEVLRPLEPPARETSPVAERGSARRDYTKQEWLERMRKRFRIPESVLAERRLRARQFFESARVAQHQQHWKEAGAAIRLAIAFDPWTEEYKTAFAEVQIRLHGLRADELVEQASEALEHGAQGDALGLLEEAMHYRPSDPEIQARAAQAALQSGDLQHAREFAERACELSPDTARYQLVLGRVRRRDGALAEAKQAFEAAARLDPRDPEAREEIKRLRQRPAPHTGGR